MAARLLDGKQVAAQVRAEVKESVRALVQRGVTPGLAVVLVGEDPASQVYVRNKDRAAAEAGFAVRTLALPAQIAQAELVERLRALNADPGVHGILVQLPLPGHLDRDAVVQSIDPRKDVDGLHAENVAALCMGRPGLVPCTPAGVIELLTRSGVALEGARACVIGRSLLVGKPLALLLLERNATVTVCHSRTRELPRVAREADLLVAAVGQARVVRADWVRPGATVVDVGINRVNEGGELRLVGDVDFESVRAVAGALTPVPGGVGPMTIAMLLANTALAAARSAGLAASALRTPAVSRG
jgi:methylenetetrahydrofolate dehydrogenase (NADP+)/methenyltetrahydrofolate cyclohydrolase